MTQIKKTKMIGNIERSHHAGKSHFPSIIQPKESISGDMTISEVVTHYPETMPVFMQHGMTCFGCPMALMETVAQGAEAHGMDAEDLVEALNKAIKKKKKIKVIK